MVMQVFENILGVYVWQPTGNLKKHERIVIRKANSGLKFKELAYVGSICRTLKV